MNPGVRVVLSWMECLYVAMFGAERQVAVLKRGAANNVLDWMPTPESVWGNHINAFGAEVAVARAVNWYIAPTEYRHGAVDIGNVIEVKYTDRDTGRLLLHDRTPDDAACFLVTGAIPTFVVHGWIWGRDAKRAEFWNEPRPGRPCYAVPRDALRAVTSFPHDLQPRRAA